MSKVVLDTDILSEYLKGHDKTVAGLATGKPARPTFRDGLATDYVTAAVLASAQSRKWVRVKR